MYVLLKKHSINNVTNAGDEINTEDHAQQKSGEFGFSDMEMSDDDCQTNDSEIVHQSDAEADNEEEKKRKFKMNKLKQLEDTVRGYPFIYESFIGKGQKMERFCRQKEVLHRELKIAGKGRNHRDTLFYVKQVFLEAAVDSPEMFEDGYTHYCGMKGFQKLESNTEIDDIIWYVSLINATETLYQASLFNMPHPKWYELRKRIDKAEKNSK